MTAPLFDIKAKFSEYVTMAENGDVVEIAMAESVIKKELSEYWRMYVELETYINNIPDSFTRRIFRMRFIDGLTWGKIAMTIGGNQTSDSVRMICKRFLNNEEKH